MVECKLGTTSRRAGRARLRRQTSSTVSEGANEIGSREEAM
jgi:hypothetical protein